MSSLPADAATFRAQYPYPFLVRRPVSVFREDYPIEVQNFEYNTVAVSEDEDGIPPWDWWICPVRKRPDNPFPDHLSVGRAPNCDVVMRFRYVSKLHARFGLREGAPISLEDIDSSNGTGINGNRLKPHVPVTIRSGDRLSFGSLVVEFMEPDDFFLLLRRRASLSQGPPSSASRR